MSTTVNELVALLEKTRPPKPLLVYHPKFYAPKYIVDAVTELTGRFHPPPFSPDEWKAIQAAKIAADKSEEQTRADEVFPNLLVGNQMAAEDVQYLVDLGVTHLLNTASGDDKQPDRVRPNAVELERLGIKLLNLEIKDKANVEIKEHFLTTGAWIGQALAKPGGRVLVNCYQGASRSATVVLAYMVQEGLSLREALVKVKSGRDVRPNVGFLQQLIEWERHCQGAIYNP